MQRDRLEAEVVAWGRGRESWSVDYRIFEGRTSEPEVWARLEEFRTQTYAGEGGVELPIARMFVDSGDGTTTNDVYNWVRQRPAGQVYAIKGVEKGDRPVGLPSAVDVTVAGKKIRKGLRIRTIVVSFFKAEFYADLWKRAPTEEERRQGWTYPPGFCHFPSDPDYGDEHFKQLCAEQLVRRSNRRTGRTKTEWQQMRPRNEALDCRVYARAAAWDCGLDRMQEKSWQMLESRMGIARQADPGVAERQATRAPEPPVPPHRARDPWRQDRRRDSWLGGRARHWLR